MTWLSSQVSNAITPRLNAWESYNAITSKIVEAAEPSRLVAARRLFGFKSPSSDLHTSPSYIVAEGSLIAQCATKYHVKPRRNAHDELLVPAARIDQIIKAEYRAYLSGKLHEIYSGLIRSGWTSLYVFKPRVRSAGLSGPVSRAVTSDLGFKNRLGMTAMALDAFAPVRHVPFKAKPSRDNPSLLQLWVRHLFDIVYPVTGIFEEFASPSQSSYHGARACIRQFLIDTSSADLSTFVIVNSLAMQLEPHGPNANSILHPTPAILSENRLLEKYMVDAFFNWEEVHGLTVVNFGLSEILQSSEEPLDAVVLVHLVEAITCEMLYHMHATHSDPNSGFSELILPYSWARLLAKRYANSPIVRDTSSLETFLEVIARISDGLGDRESNRWWVGQELLFKKPDIVHILHLRLCWCISLLLANSQSAPQELSANLVDSLTHVLAGNPSERMGGAIYRRFEFVADSESCLQTLCETFNHETLVGLAHDDWVPVTWRDYPDVLVIPFTEPAALTNQLLKSLRS